MDIKVKSGGKKAIASGIFVTINNEDNEISFKYENEEFKFKLSFIRDNSGKQRMDYSPNEEKDKLLMKFYNFNNAIGSGLINPMHIADSNDKKIYIEIIIHSITDNIKQVSYTFYIDN